MLYNFLTFFLSSFGIVLFCKGGIRISPFLSIFQLDLFCYVDFRWMSGAMDLLF